MIERSLARETAQGPEYEVRLIMTFLWKQANDVMKPLIRNKMAAKLERRNSTGNLKDDKAIDRLKKEHFLHPDSDHVDLNLLLRAVLDINDSLEAEEKETANGEVTGQRRKHTRYTDGQTLEEKAAKFGSETGSVRSCVSRSSRPSSAVRCDSRKPPLERKNMSFCNSRVDDIDRENLRLLKQISQKKPRPKSATVTRRAVSEPLRVQTSSHVNRQRFQQKVDSENQQILRRLQAVRPTRSLSKDFLLKEHSVQKQYSKNASRSRPSSAKSRTSQASSMSYFSRASSETNMSVNDTASVASSRGSTASRRFTRKEFSKPSWEAGW